MFDEEEYEDMDSEEELNYHTSWSSPNEHQLSITVDEKRVSDDSLQIKRTAELANPNYKSNHYSERGNRIDELLAT